MHRTDNKIIFSFDCRSVSTSPATCLAAALRLSGRGLINNPFELPTPVEVIDCEFSGSHLILEEVDAQLATLLRLLTSRK